MHRLYSEIPNPERWTIVTRSGFASIEEAVQWLERLRPVEVHPRRRWHAIFR
jgi:hypothetical protein